MTSSAGNDGSPSASSVDRIQVAPLESILRTEELLRRPSRPPNHEKENRALSALAQALADTPETILQTLADAILDVCQAGSAGISLLTTNDGAKTFYWSAIAGEWKAHIGGGTPRDFGPCGDVLDRNRPLLFGHLEDRYTYFKAVKPSVEEALLVPFYIGDKAVGTIWAVAHDSHKFDAEDERLLCSLGKFASSAYQVVMSLEALRSQVAERTRAEEELRTSEERFRILANELEIQVDIRTRELRKRNDDIVQQSEELRELSARLRQSQDDERRRIARDLHDSAGQIVTALGMNLASMSRQIENVDVAKTVQESGELLDQLGKEIRTLSYLLHPPLLDETGLREAIRFYVQGLTERSGLNVTLEIPEEFGRLPDEIELAMFRIVQECLTNIHRHSGSKTATIRILLDEKTVSLEVQDSGSGLPSGSTTGTKRRHSGVGIAGMRERVRHLAGTMSIESSKNGTKISVTLPATVTSPHPFNTSFREVGSHE